MVLLEKEIRDHIQVAEGQREELRQKIVACDNKSEREELAKLQSVILGMIGGLHIALGTDPAQTTIMASDPFWFGIGEKRQYDHPEFD